MNKIIISAKIGSQLKSARATAQLSQNDVAQMLGVTVQCISSWERDRTFPSSAMLEKLAQAYGCSVDDLTVNMSLGEMSILQIEDLALNLDEKGLDRVIAYANYLKTKVKR